MRPSRLQPPQGAAKVLRPPCRLLAKQQKILMNRQCCPSRNPPLAFPTALFSSSSSRLGKCSPEACVWQSPGYRHFCNNWETVPVDQMRETPTRHLQPDSTSTAASLCCVKCVKSPLEVLQPQSTRSKEVLRSLGYEAALLNVFVTCLYL